MRHKQGTVSTHPTANVRIRHTPYDGVLFDVGTVQTCPRLDVLSTCAAYMCGAVPVAEGPSTTLALHRWRLWIALREVLAVACRALSAR